MRLAGRALAKNTCSRRFVPTRLALLLTLGRLTDSHRTRQSSQPVVIRRNLPQPKASAGYPFESGGEPILCCLGNATDAKGAVDQSRVEAWPDSFMRLPPAYTTVSLCPTSGNASVESECGALLELPFLPADFHSSIA